MSKERTYRRGEARKIARPTLQDLANAYQNVMRRQNTEPAPKIIPVEPGKKN